MSLRVLRVAIAFTVVVALLIAIATWHRKADSRHDEAIAALRATHYWGGSYPKSFWDGLDVSRIDRDFTRIRDDGFNAIVLAVSWTDFQPRLTPDPVYDERPFAHLVMLVRKAREHELAVALRVGFPWSLRPDAELPNAERIEAAFGDDRVRAAWVAFVGEVCRRVCAEPNLVLAFLSWEDLVPYNLLGAEPQRTHPAFRRDFIAYLQGSRTLGDVARDYGQTFTSWDQVPVPSRRSPAYALVLEWWDRMVVDRFVQPGRRVFPILALEARVDRDPVWRGDTVAWTPHDAMVAQTGAATTVLYFSVAWGMRNEGDMAEAPAVLAQLDRLLDETRRRAGRSALFIDQFNFVDNTPGFERHTRLAEHAYDPMLAGSAELLSRHRAGYALWTDTDYAANVLYNARFQRGVEGWTASGGATIVAAPTGASALHLESGAGVTQHVAAGGMGEGFAAGARGTVCIEGRALGDRAVEVELAGLPGSPLALTLAPESARQCAEAALAPDFALTLRAGGAPVSIAGVELYRHTQRSRVYALDGSPGPQRDAIRALNRELARRHGT